MTTDTEHDVICHMDITIASSAGSSDYEGRTYYFCAMGCKRDFDNDPAAALQAEAAYDHSAPMDHGMTASSAPAGGEKKPWWKFW
jgi:YHS domain-containing protein